MRFTNSPEQIGDQASQLLAEPDRPAHGFEKGKLEHEIAALRQERQRIDQELQGLRTRLAQARAFLIDDGVRDPVDGTKAGVASLALGAGVGSPPRPDATIDRRPRPVATEAHDTGPPPVGTIRAGVEAYRAGRYEQAIEIWRPLAEQGKAKAQFHLGAMLLEGRVAPPDAVGARRWLEKALANGYRPASSLLSTIDGVADKAARDGRQPVSAQTMRAR